jgi:uncharacterized protein involved in exopolysaccharide biosynthesis
MERLKEIGTLSEYEGRAAEVEAEPARIVSFWLLWAERRFLLRAAVFGLVLSLVVSFLLPVRYESQTRLMPPEQQGGSGIAMLAALGSKGIGDSTSGSSGSSDSSEALPGAGFRGGLGSIPADLLGLKPTGAMLADLLRGPTVQDTLIQKFDLRKRYHTRYFQDTRKVLDSHTTIKEDRKSGVISIAVTDRDPYRAQQMATAYVEAVNTLLAQVSASSARRERMFLEQRITTAKKSLDAAAQEYSVYASKTGALDVPAQTKAMVGSEGALEGKLVAAESELQGLQQIYTDNNIRIRTLQARIAELKQQVENLSGISNGHSPQSQIAGDMPSFRKLPLVAVRWTNLYRESKIQEAIYEMLTQEYELAKIQEAKETPTINVLDAAMVPERKSFPPRTIITILGGLLSLLFAAAFVIAAAKWRKSDSPEKQLAAEIWRDFRADNARSRAMLLRFRKNVGAHFGNGNGHE